MDITLTVAIRVLRLGSVAGVWHDDGRARHVQPHLAGALKTKFGLAPFDVLTKSSQESASEN